MSLAEGIGTDTMLKISDYHPTYILVFATTADSLKLTNSDSMLAIGDSVTVRLRLVCRLYLIVIGDGNLVSTIAVKTDGD